MRKEPESPRDISGALIKSLLDYYSRLHDAVIDLLIMSHRETTMLEKLKIRAEEQQGKDDKETAAKNADASS